jgi:hypothetical protein
MHMSADVCLLCCIPLQETEWLERFACEDYGDFVRSNTEEKFNGNLQQTWRMFSREATFIQKKLDVLAKKQVEVVLRAGCTHIREAAARYENVVVIAHWKHERILSSDIRALESLWRHLLEVAPDLQLPEMSTHEPWRLRGHLRDILDTLVLQGGSNLVTIPGDLGSGRLPASVLRREMLNVIPFLAPGNRLETWDAMLSAEQFSELFGKRFEGTALMAICNSALLAETFRVRHPNAICICNRDTANAGLNLAKLDAALTLMRAKQISLSSALNEIGDVVDSLAT